MKRAIVYLICVLSLASCRGAALKSLRNVFRKVPGKELQRIPKSGRTKSTNRKPDIGIDDLVDLFLDNLGDSIKVLQSGTDFRGTSLVHGSSFPMGQTNSSGFPSIDIKVPSITVPEVRYSYPILSYDKVGTKPALGFGSKVHGYSQGITNIEFDKKLDFKTNP